jgi:hypothetical protein
MATLNLRNIHSKFANIFVDREGFLISFSLNNNGLSLVTSFRLNHKFRLNEDSIYIDEKVFDAFLGSLTHTIGQSPICDGVSKQWLLKPRKL